MVDIVVTDTAKRKATRQYKDSYLTEDQIRDCIQTGGGQIYRETSPVNPEMYPDNEFIWRVYDPMRVDFAIVVQDNKVIVKTQMSHHTETEEYDGSEFYEEIGSSLTEMLNSIDSWV